MMNIVDVIGHVVFKKTKHDVCNGLTIAFEILEALTENKNCRLD